MIRQELDGKPQCQKNATDQLALFRHRVSGIMLM